MTKPLRAFIANAKILISKVFKKKWSSKPKKNDPSDKVLEIIDKLTKIDADDKYIYRGERKYYGKVSSGLYRQYQDTDIEGIDIEVVQKEMVKKAKKYTDLTDEHEILSELQHFGGKTNLIDFTTKFYIALFFACDGAMEEDGRVIVMQNSENASKHIWCPRDPKNRTDAQKSVFVQPKKGYLEQQEWSHTINVPHNLKNIILEVLRKSHGISTETIYNDLHGFIKYQSRHISAFGEIVRGLIYQNQHNNVKAIEHYTKAIELKPDDPEAYNDRGFVYCEKGDFEKAIQDCTKAIELKPDLAEAYNNRGGFYYKKGDFKKAIQDCTKAIELKPDYAGAYNNRGSAYNGMRKFDQAIQDCTKAIELKLDYAESYYNRGLVYCEKGDFEKAIQDCTKAIELKPDYAGAYSNRGYAYCEKGDFEKAIQDCTKAIELKPDLAEAYNNRGKAYSGMRKFDQAIQDYTMVIKLKLYLAKIYYNRGIAYLMKGYRYRALRDLKVAEALAKDQGLLDLLQHIRKLIDLLQRFGNYLNQAAKFLNR